jgi:hypothetical protein
MSRCRHDYCNVHRIGTALPDCTIRSAQREGIYRRENGVAIDRKNTQVSLNVQVWIPTAMASIVYLFAGRQVRQRPRLPGLELRAPAASGRLPGLAHPARIVARTAAKRDFNGNMRIFHLDMEADDLPPGTARTSEGQPNERK